MSGDPAFQRPDVTVPAVMLCPNAQQAQLIAAPPADHGKEQFLFTSRGARLYRPSLADNDREAEFPIAPDPARPTVREVKCLQAAKASLRNDSDLEVQRAQRSELLVQRVTTIPNNKTQITPGGRAAVGAEFRLDVGPRPSGPVGVAQRITLSALDPPGFDINN